PAVGPRWRWGRRADDRSDTAQASGVPRRFRAGPWATLLDPQAQRADDRATQPTGRRTLAPGHRAGRPLCPLAGHGGGAAGPLGVAGLWGSRRRDPRPMHGTLRPRVGCATGG